MGTIWGCGSSMIVFTAVVASRPKVSDPLLLSFNDIHDSNSQSGQTNIETANSTEEVKINLVWNTQTSFHCYLDLNGTETDLGDSDTTVNHVINESDQVSFKFYMPGNVPPDPVCDVDVTLYRLNDDLIDTFNVYLYKSSCYLTTACVNYKGLEDDGDELKAMRDLRDNWMIPNGYKGLIDEYYINAGEIINKINQSKEPSKEYNKIFCSVKRCQDLVVKGRFEEAYKEYLKMYYRLAKKYCNTKKHELVKEEILKIQSNG